MKNILTKKAMTLFELLAVIVILGIILAIGFPTVNRLITNSRKDTFAANVNSYIYAAKTDALIEWAETNSVVNRVYYIGKEEELPQIPGNPTLVSDNFGLNGFVAGAVHVMVNSDGSIEFVNVIVGFSNGNLTLREASYKEGEGLKDIKDTSFNRDNVE